ncbi:hypothetical protein EDB83DRAFT_2515887 [Lactarius deliciosus]|nr:hypothetical protein EDB83DRAFT_2515887 [Lactarius deliciosus]
MGVLLLYATRTRFYCLSVASGSLSHESRDASSRPTSTTVPSPDTTNRHPFYAISAASAGVSGVTQTPALSAFSLWPTPVYSAFFTLPTRRYAPFPLISPPSRPSLAASRLD